jgi:hypothetical protein
VYGLLDVVACEQLAVHQMSLLGARLPAGAGLAATELIRRLADLLPPTAEDRAWGLDLALIRRSWS